MGRKLWLGAAAAAAAIAGGSAATAQTPAEQGRIAALEARIARAADAAARLEDAAQIRRLQAAYGYYLDRGLWSEVAELFADDATIEFGNEGVYVGKPRIRQYFQRLGGGRTGLAPGALNSRYLLMPVITVAPDGKSAMGRWKDMAMTGQFQKAADWGDGTYENTYVKVGGAWKIASLHRYTTYVAPYEKGWSVATGEPDISVAAKGFPADRPPTFAYDPFPGVYIPPYHPQPYAFAGDPLLKGVKISKDVPPAAPAPPAPRTADASTRSAGGGQ
jgi:hypothetical protein